MKKLILCSMIAGMMMLFAACGANQTSQPVSPSPAASPAQTVKASASPSVVPSASPIASPTAATATP